MNTLMRLLCMLLLLVALGGCTSYEEGSIEQPSTVPEDMYPPPDEMASAEPSPDEVAEPMPGLEDGDPPASPRPRPPYGGGFDNPLPAEVPTAGDADGDAMPAPGYEDDMMELPGDEPEDASTVEPPKVNYSIEATVDGDMHYPDGGTLLRVRVGYEGMVGLPVLLGDEYGSTTLRKRGDYVKVVPVESPNGLEFTAEVEEGKDCFKVVPEGSDVVFRVTPEDWGDFDIFVQVHQYHEEDCSGQPILDASTNVRVTVAVDWWRPVLRAFYDLWMQILAATLAFLVALYMGLLNKLLQKLGIKKKQT